MQRNIDKKEPRVDTQDKTQNLIRFKLVQKYKYNNLETEHINSKQHAKQMKQENIGTMHENK